MPDAPKTQHRSMRVSDKRWEKLGAVATPNRAVVINALIAWYLREPGAELPERPGDEPEVREYRVRVHQAPEHVWAEVDDVDGRSAEGERRRLAEAISACLTGKGSK